MKQEIINRIKQLGGNVTNVKGTSLSEDLCAITFNTALYKKPEDTPWLSAEDTEPIEGLGDWVDENTELFNSDREAFYKKMVDAYYTLNEDPRRQLFWVAKPFTPFQEGTKDFDYAIQNGVSKGQAKGQKNNLEVNKNDLYYRQFLNSRNIKEFSFKGISLGITREVASHIANPLQLGIDLLVLVFIFFLYKRIKKKNKARA